MTEKLTVIECVVDPGNGYMVLLSNGETKKVDGAYPIGVVYVEPVAPSVPPAPKDVEIDKLREDNAMLVRGLNDANATIASLSDSNSALARKLEDLEQSGGQMKAPASLTNVMTRDVADLPPLDALAPAPPMEMLTPPVSLSDEEEVKAHLARKAHEGTKT